MLGRFDEAIAARERNRQLNPASPFAIANVGYPYFSWGYLWIAQVYVQQGMYDEAITEIDKAIALSGGNVRERSLRLDTLTAPQAGGARR